MVGTAVKSCVAIGTIMLFLAVLIIPLNDGYRLNDDKIIYDQPRSNSSWFFGKRASERFDEKIDRSPYATTITNEKTEATTGGPINSSWPMFHHDIQHTGRSPFGANGNWYKVKWRSFLMEGLTSSSPAIDMNGTIYIGADDFQKSFFAINPNGTEKWHVGVGQFIFSSPAIGSDNIVYVGSNDGGLYAFYMNGTEKWRVHLGASWVTSSPVIGNDGTIYASSVGSSRICAVNPNGTIKWYFNAKDYIYCDPAIDNDGTIYTGSNDGYEYAIYPNGTLKWKYYTGGQDGPATTSIGDDGSIYVGGTSGQLYAFYHNGTLHWKIATGWIGGSTPAFSTDGTIYVGDQDNHRIYSITPNGNINWYYTTGDDIISSPAIDKNGIIYCGSVDGNLYALNPNGTLRWKFHAGKSIESSPVIGADGTIYIAGEFLGSDFYTYLYALQIINEQPPIIPTISGPTSGKANQNYNYTVVSTDPEGNNISYYVDWGDGTNTGWIGPYTSGHELTINHTWNKRGTYTIKAKAMDNYSAESGWGTLQVTMPLVYEPPHFRFFEWLFERFPHAFPILRQLLGY
jgi:outer membrane protein assembly factor BamB